MSYLFIRISLIAVSVAGLLAFTSVVQSQQEGGSRPDGAYRVMPIFPGEEVAPPPVAGNQAQAQSGGVRRAIVINPDGSVEGGGLPTQQETPFAPAVIPEVIQPQSIPGANGMDGIPKDPSRPIQLDIVSPTDRQILTSQDVDIFLKLENYQLGPAESGGNRLHYILDNQPPRVITDAISPITFKNLSQGGHTIRVFAVRPDGRMFRNPEAYAMRHFYVIRKDFQNYTDPDKEYLTVNLPTGEQVATDEEGRIIFDYKLHNVVAGSGYELRYKIGAYEGYLSQDGPVYWSNLSTGKHRIEVELLKDNRQPAIGPFNRVDREFTVEKVMRAEVVIPGAGAEAEVMSE